MTELSPAAQAVLDAIDFDEMSGPQQIVACAHAAAALRAAADQVVPRDGSRRANEIRSEFLAIAAELEGVQ